MARATGEVDQRWRDRQKSKTGEPRDKRAWAALYQRGRFFAVEMRLWGCPCTTHVLFFCVARRFPHCHPVRPAAGEACDYPTSSTNGRQKTSTRKWWTRRGKRGPDASSPIFLSILFLFLSVAAEPRWVIRAIALLGLRNLFGRSQTCGVGHRVRRSVGARPQQCLAPLPTRPDQSDADRANQILSAVV